MTRTREVASAESQSQQSHALRLPVSRGWRVVVASALRWKTHPALSMEICPLERISGLEVWWWPWPEELPVVGDSAARAP